MPNVTSISLLFILTITLHNIEEGLWLPQWSQFAGKYHKPVGKGEFHFALIVITALAYLVSGLFMFFPQILVLKYFFIGYVGTMIINAFVPHLVSAVVLKRYAPGLVTGIFINVPLNSLIINYVIRNKVISLYEVVFSTLVVATLLLFSLSPLFKLGGKLINFGKSV